MKFIHALTPHKAVLTLLIILSSCAAVRAQDPLEESEDRLRGPVKTVRGEYRKILYRSDRWVVGKVVLSYIESYAINSEVIKRTDYKEDGSIDYEWTPPADPNEKVGYFGCSTCEGKTEFRILPEYDFKGRVSKELEKTLDGRLIGWREFKFDDLDNLIEERRFAGAIFAGAILLNTELYTYDEKGRRATTKQLHSDGRLDRSWEYRYDVNGALVEQIACNSDGEILSRLTLKYDAQGNVTEQDQYDKGQRLSHRTEYVYNYDLNGNWVERQTYSTSWLTTLDPPRVIPRSVTGIQYRRITYY